MTVEAYPYFKLAKQHGLDYGMVQSFMWAYHKKFTDLNYWETQATKQLQHTELGTKIISAYNTEMTRRAAVWNS